MSQYRYHLEPYRSKANRYTCPACKSPHQFTRYIDTETGEYLADNVGICNRLTSCGYHYSPKDYFRDNKILNPNQHTPISKRLPVISPEKKIHKENMPQFIPPEIFQKSLSNYENNNLIQYLKTIFDEETVFYLINIYKIGTSNHFGGGTTIFWQLDTAGKIRTGKLIKYDPKTGKRIKKPFVATNWVHALEYKKGYNLSQCLFGEHLLAEDLISPVAIVESEKTAIIALAKMPEYLWLATGSLTEFKPAKLNILKNRKVVAFPDLGTFDIWKKKASEMSFYIKVSDYLERNATNEQRKKGLDIADFL